MGFTNRNGGMLPPLKWWSFTNMVGKLPDWNDCVGTGPVGTSEKSLGLLFLQLPCQKKMDKTHNYRFSVGNIPCWCTALKKSPEVRIIYLHLQPKKIIEIPAKNHPQGAYRFPGSFTGSMARPSVPTCCWRCVAHLWGSSQSPRCGSTFPPGWKDETRGWKFLSAG